METFDDEKPNPSVKERFEQVKSELQEVLILFHMRDEVDKNHKAAYMEMLEDRVKGLESEIEKLESLTGGKGGFSLIRQGTATNALTKIKATKGQKGIGAFLDGITGAAKITRKTAKGNFTVSLPHFMKLEGLRTSTHQLFDALIVAFTEGAGRSSVVKLPFKKYMEMRGLSDEKEARRQALADLETIFDARITLKEESKGKKGKPRDFQDIRIFDAKGTIKNSVITASFGATFFNLLQTYPVMPYPPQLWRLNGNKNPNSFYFLRRITEHKNMNKGKANEDLISVKTLLDSSPCLPSVEDVKGAGRQLGQRIIDPFIRDMDALEESLAWSLWAKDKNGNLISESREGLDFDRFEALLVKVDWRQYPARLPRKKQGGGDEQKTGKADKKKGG